MSSEDTSAPARLNPDNPWPGLQSYDESAKGYFFGREAEIDALLRMTRHEELTVLYGQSGLGKTSLLRAGLFPRLRAVDLLPIRIRLDYSLRAPSLCAQVKEAIAAALREHEIEAPLPSEQESLWEYFHRSDVDFWDGLNRLVTLVLVFDQFEERFTLGRQAPEADTRAEVFITELSELVGNRLPPALHARFEAHPELVGAFDFDKVSCKVVLSLREDFLPELEGLRDRLPGILQSRFRLLPLNKAQAIEVVKKPGAQLVDEGTAVAIVEYVACSRRHLRDGEIEPALLSLFLQGLNSRRRERGQTQMRSDLLSGDKEKILEDFYEGALADLPAEARLFLEDGLLTASGYRDSIAQEDARAEFHIDGVVLDALVNRHLVRREERLGTTRLELVHDLLTGVIVSSRERRLERLRREENEAREWRSNNAFAVGLASRLNSTGEAWAKDTRSMAAILMKGPVLYQAVELLEKHPVLLKPEARVFVIESQRARRRGALLWAAVAAFALALVIWNSIALNGGNRLAVFLRTLFFLVTPPVLGMLDRIPLRVRLNTYAWNAWRWTVYCWITYLVANVYVLNPANLLESSFGFILVAALLLVPLFKWRAYAGMARQSVGHTPRAPRAPKIALFTTASLPVLVIILFIAFPQLCEKATPQTTPKRASKTTAFNTVADGWVVRTVTEESGSGGRIVEVSYFEPAEVDEGFHRIETRYDEKNAEVEVTAFDLDGKAISRPDSGTGGDEN